MKSWQTEVFGGRNTRLIISTKARIFGVSWCILPD